MVVDDHSIVRKGIRSLLSEASDMSLVGEAQDGREGLEKALRLRPDVVILDISLPDQGGLEVLKSLRENAPDMAVLVLSMHAESRYAVPLLRAGAAGYVAKRGPAETLIEAIRKVAQGGKFISPQLAEHLAFDLGPDAREPAHRRLSARELQVLLMVVEGNSLTSIGERLGISVKTVSTYRRRILEKMGMGSTAELVRYAYDHQLAE